MHVFNETDFTTFTSKWFRIIVAEHNIMKHKYENLFHSTECWF